MISWRLLLTLVAAIGSLVLVAWATSEQPHRRAARQRRREWWEARGGASTASVIVAVLILLLLLAGLLWMGTAVLGDLLGLMADE